MARLGRKERMSDLCREYGISRKTGDKFKERFERLGLAGLEDGSRAPHVIPHKTPPELEEVIIAERRAHPTWGPRKIKEVLERRLGHPLPSHGASVEYSSARALSRHGNVAPVSAEADAPAGDDQSQRGLVHRLQRPVSSRRPHVLLPVDHHRPRTAATSSRARAWRQSPTSCPRSLRRGVLRMGNARRDPFRQRSAVCFTGLGGLTRLSGVSAALGIELERIRPSHPEENGRHERMHRTLKAETTRPAGQTCCSSRSASTTASTVQPERPHEALEMKRPIDVHARSTRALPSSLPELEYSTHDDVVRVTRSGQSTCPASAP